MQKKCTCEEITPYCCTGGWQLILAGSRFTKGAEERYAPVEGEALAVEWALESTKHYTLGNHKLLVATDHKPLLKILGDRRLEDIPNPRLVQLKEKTLRWKFSIMHIPGKIHIGPDTLSRREVIACLVAVIGAKCDSSDWVDRELMIESVAAAQMPTPISWSRLRDCVNKDHTMKLLCDQIVEGFPPEKKLLRLELREYWHHRENLSHVDGVPLFKGRVVIPVTLRDEVLETLHSAHQGNTGMLERAQASVWWPGITPRIKEKRAKCRNCNENAPTQPAAPPEQLTQPDYPFQQIVSDYFQEQGHHYLVIADRFSGWPTLLHCGGSTASKSLLIDTLKTYFSTYGIPEELSTDGGSTFTAYETRKFLADYGVRHRLSSVAFPHSNQRAEIAVKSMKRLLRENIGMDGKLNTDSFQRAVMQYRNTPDRDTGRSPAQVIFGRQLRDFLPAPLTRYKPHPRWLLLQEDRENALRKRALRNMENLQRGTRFLQPLSVGDVVQVQNQVGCRPSKWDITGVVVEKGDHDQYMVRIHGSGRLTLRNRRFLKKIIPYSHGVVDRDTRALSDLGDDSVLNRLNVNEDSDNQTTREDDHQEVTIPQEEKELEKITDQIQEQIVDEPRRSTRQRVQPERLDIKSWKGKSYDVASVPLDESEVWYESEGKERHSVQSNRYALHQEMTGGGRGHRWVYSANPKPNIKVQTNSPWRQSRS